MTIKHFIIQSWVDKYLSKKIQRYDISLFLKNINLFATDDRGIIASITEREFQSKVIGMYNNYKNPKAIVLPEWKQEVQQPKLSPEQSKKQREDIKNKMKK